MVTILLLKLIYGMQQMISHVFLQETEEPDAIVSKQGGKMFLLFVGWKKITTSVGIHNTVAALLSYIGTYYILDFQHPRNQEVRLTILHYLFFQDTSNILVLKYFTAIQ